MNDRSVFTVRKCRFENCCFLAKSNFKIRVRLRDIVSKVEIYFDPNPEETIISEDQEFVEDSVEFNDEYSRMLRNTIPFTVRLILDRAEKECRIEILSNDTAEIIREKYWDRIICLLSSDNADKLVLQLKISPCWLDYTNHMLYDARKKQQRKENISDEDMNVFYNNDDFARVGGFMHDWENDDDGDYSTEYADIIQHLADCANNLMDEVELR